MSTEDLLLQKYLLSQQDATDARFRVVNSNPAQAREKYNKYLISLEEANQNKLKAYSVPYSQKFYQKNDFVSINKPDSSKLRMLRARDIEYNSHKQKTAYDLEREGFGDSMIPEERMMYNFEGKMSAPYVARSKNYDSNRFALDESGFDPESSYLTHLSNNIANDGILRNYVNQRQARIDNYIRNYRNKKPGYSGPPVIARPVLPIASRVRYMKGPSLQEYEKQEKKRKYMAKLDGHAEKVKFEEFINY